MKPTSLTPKCMPAARRAVRTGKSALVHAHTPARHWTPRAWVEPGPAEQAAIKPRPLIADTAGPRVLHIDTENGTAAVLARLLGSDVHVTHVTTVARARQLLQDQIFSLVILDPTLPDGDASQLLPLLADTPLLVYSDQQPLWRDGPAPPPRFLPKSLTTARQLWTAMAAMLFNTSALSAGD